MEEDDTLNFQRIGNELQAIIDRSELQNHLKMQLEEIEVLQAMYYKAKEFEIYEPVLIEVNKFIHEITSQIPPLIEFGINLKQDKYSLEIQITLPRTYPTSEPSIIVRSNELSKQEQKNLNDALKSYVNSLDRGDICIFECINWITENLTNYCDTKEEPVPMEKKQEVFTRYWIYSHHIYSKEKRKFIISWAQRYQVTGFCLSGKPGIICGEGINEDCEEWWQKIKSMTWKKIMCKKIEEYSVTDIKELRRFENFEEISFINAKNNSRETHTDMGEFYRYLVKHHCGHVFRDYFGIEGKIPNIP